MLPFEDRYSRQRRLAEVGPEGQVRLERAAARVADYAGADVEREYLTRAGFGRVEAASSEAVVSFAHADCFRFAASRSVAWGAWSALRQVRRVLGISPEEGA